MMNEIGRQSVCLLRCLTLSETRLVWMSDWVSPDPCETTKHLHEYSECKSTLSIKNCSKRWVGWVGWKECREQG